MKSLSTLLLLFTTLLAQGQLSTNKISFGDLRARDIGPAVMSGRVSAVTGVNEKPEIIYIGAASGGVWKSESAGASFRPIFDDYTQSIGYIAIDQDHPDTVWVGTGEQWVRNSVSVGDGVYVSTNGGNTWTHKGLPNSERISKVIVHPNNSNVIYVAAQGPLWSKGEERGVFRSDDFGATWQKVLYVNDGTGAADLTISQTNPNILYAAMWEHQRYPDFFNSGGSGSGLYKSMDGGIQWTKLTNGLPTGQLGRIAVEVAPNDENRVYATIECENKEEKGLYRSDDGGSSWELVNSDFNTTVRPFYFSRLHIDPNDKDKVYKGGLNAIVSDDGGEKFRTIESGVHSDIHDIWVNPQNSKHVLLATDGGMYRSLDGAYQFEHFENLPLSQFYQISVDNATPYNVYGGLQDNGSWFGPSSTQTGVITNSDWKLTYYGDGFYSYRHPTREDIVYSEAQGGMVARYSKKDGQAKNIAPIPIGENEKLRFNWNTPIHTSTHKPDRLYVGAQFLFRSENMGDSWDRISPDLTTNDKERQRQSKSGGLSIDNSTAENNTTIYVIEESKSNDQIIWIGTDDGLIHVTSDAGKNWTNVSKNIPGLPPGLWVSSINSSDKNPDVAYATIDGHRSGDKAVYVFRTEDRGASWTSISEGVEGYAHVIKEDLVKPNILYLGTEFGLYISVDQGTSWKRFSNNLPKTPVHDLALPTNEDDLVIGTHGRGIYIIDDLAPIRQLSDEIVNSTLAFFDQDPAVVKNMAMGRPFTGAGKYAGSNPSNVATISYYMKKRHVFGKMTLDVYDDKGNWVANLPAGKSKGINIVQLPLRLPRAKAAPTKNRMALFGSILSPSLSEGTYQVVIKKGKEEFKSNITLKSDPTGEYSVADKALQLETNKTLYDLTNQLGHIYYSLEKIEKHVEKIKKAGQLSDNMQLKNIGKEAADFKNSLVSLGGDFYVDEGEANIREDISSLALNVSQYPGRPSDGQLRKTKELQERMGKIQGKANMIFEDLKAVNAMLEKAGVDTLTLKSFKDFMSE